MTVEQSQENKVTPNGRKGVGVRYEGERVEIDGEVARALGFRFVSYDGNEGRIVLGHAPDNTKTTT